MESPLDKAIERSDLVVASVEDSLVRSPGIGAENLSPMNAGGSTFQRWGEDRIHREAYQLFRGVLYSAVNALATEAASQPVCLGEPHIEEKGEKRPLPHMKKDSTPAGFDVIESHPLLDVLECPNPIQDRFQFVYNFVSNICLTGWGYIVAGDNNGRLELYSIPTNWIRPVHDPAPFSSFVFQNPSKGGSEGTPLERNQVAFAYQPDPSDPLSATSPAKSQMQAIRADDFIWSSREQFFENGIFPGAIVTIGKDPHPDVQGGVRPRLTAAQRRQVHAAIKKVMSGVSNYGNPAIVDGMIEKIERLSASNNEMGWEKSAIDTKKAILSAFCVHPFILGEEVAVGGYAQAAIIESRFAKRVNVYLTMLSSTLTNFLNRIAGGSDLKIWWKPSEPEDPDLKWKNVWAARANGDITTDEVRAMLGLPPKEAEEAAEMSSNDIYPIVAVMGQMALGSINGNQAAALLQATGVSAELANQLGGVLDVPTEGGVEEDVEPAVSTEMVSNIISLLSQVGMGTISPGQAEALMLAMGIPNDAVTSIVGLASDSSSTFSPPLALSISTELRKAMTVLKESAEPPVLIEDLSV